MDEESFDMAKYNTELDSAIAGVMPDSWEGHSRLAVNKVADGLSEKELQFAKELAARSHKPGHAEKVASVAVEKTKEKLR